MHHGSCLCGAIRIAVDGELGDCGTCHCTQCRKQTGHYFASAEVQRAALSITGENRLSWFVSSPGVRRGFCAVCGSVLFWDQLGRDFTEVAMGAFDSPTGATLTKHIFVADKGDYYMIGDGVPQFAAR